MDGGNAKLRNNVTLQYANAQRSMTNKAGPIASHVLSTGAICALLMNK